MSASAVDQILRLWACLEPHGMQWPGKPPKFRQEVPLGRRKLLAVRGEKGGIIGHYRAACGASHTQTRGARMDGFTAMDVAAAAGAAVRGLDREYVALFEFVTGSAKPGLKAYLLTELTCSLIAEARWRKWDAVDGPMAERIADVALRMVVDADGCKACNTQGHTLDEDGRAMDCAECKGSGHIAYPERQIAAEVDMPRSTYNRKLAPAVHWAHALLQGRAHTVLGAIKAQMERSDG